MSRRFKVPTTLYRGDSSEAVSVPNPHAKANIVAHILYLGSYGRETQYTSTSENEEDAEHFAGGGGAVWRALVAEATRAGAIHLSKQQLLGMLKGFGMGRAKWTNRAQVQEAHANVVEWNEHLFDWENVTSGIDQVIAGVFSKRSKLSKGSRRKQ